MATEAATAPPADTAERGNVPAEGVTQQQEGSFGDAFADLDKAFGEPAAEPTPPPKADPKPEAKTDRGPDGKFLPKKEEPKKPDPAKKDEPKAPEVPIEKMAPKQLRDAYESLRKKHSELEAEHKKAKTAPAQPQDDPEKKVLSERLTAREQRLQQLEEELRFTAYERSEEYKDKFEKPFISAWTAGQERASKLKIAEQRDELENVISPGRSGTAEDFNTLMQIQDDDEAASWANKTFGAKAAMLLFHRERVQEANGARKTALEEYRKNGSARAQQHQEMIQNQQKAVRNLFQRSVEQAIEKYPQFFKADENDPKSKSLLEKGMRLADRALGAPDAEGEKPLTMEDRIRLQAAMRNSFGAFQRVAYELHTSRQRLSDLEKKLAEYEASEPKGGEGRGGAGRPAPEGEADTPEGAFDATFGA